MQVQGVHGGPLRGLVVCLYFDNPNPSFDHALPYLARAYEYLHSIPVMYPPTCA